MPRPRLHSWPARHALEFLLLLAAFVLHLASPHFLTADNLLNILRSVSEIGVIAFGMTLVIIAGEIDLSVGAVVALSGCLAAKLVELGLPVPAAILAALAAGLGCGAFTGLMRCRYRVPSFISSLALMTALRGAALKITEGFPLATFPAWYNHIGSGWLIGLPFPVILLAVVFIAVYILSRHTPIGRAIYAVGGNAEAARLCGIPINRVRILTLAATGALASLSGIMLSSRMASASPTVAQGWELDVIAAVIVGGTSLRGGSGSVWGTLIGVLFIGIIVNGMRLLNVQEDGQLIARGLIILLAVLLSRLRAEAPV